MSTSAQTDALPPGEPGPRDDGPAGTGASPGRRASRAALLGAMFLMATSSIGPGFITQTTQFTVQLGAAFAFAILVSIVIDIALQLNVWRVIGVSGRRAQELANDVAPGLGWVLAGLLLVGGVVFNIGNVAGAGIGTEALAGIDPRWGAALSAVLAIGIFLSRWAGWAMDRVVVVLGALMLALTLYVAIVSDPPLASAARNTIAPEVIEPLAITTLVGGTIGGYIIYAGAHRLIDAGHTGPDQVAAISRTSVLAIIVTGVMRTLLFLAILGVVVSGADLTGTSQAASAFQAAAGDVGLRLFGAVFWAAAISSVVGCSYTTVSFLTSSTRTPARTRNLLTGGFIGLSLVLFLVLGKAPTTLLVFAGAFNGILLPVGIGVMLYVGWFRRDLLHGYDYPKWLLVIGSIAWLLTLYLAVTSVRPLIDLMTS